MLPPFNAQGDLPSGVHLATLAEILECFGHGVPQRMIVTERLQRVIALTQGTGKLERVFLWGSYVTDKPEPGDIDLLLVQPGEKKNPFCVRPSCHIITPSAQ